MARFKARALRASILVLAGLLASCEVAPENVSDPAAERAVPPEPTPMKGFSWVIGEQVAGMPRPGAARPLDQDVQFLREQSIDVLVSLTENPVDPEVLGQNGIESMHIPVADFHAPTQEQLDTYVSAVKGWISAGRQVGTHCGAGLGRTGTFLAALFVARGMDADTAIEEVRRLRPGSIETAAQEQAIRDFAARHQKP